MRKSDVFLIVLSAGAVLAVLMFIHVSLHVHAGEAALRAQAELAGKLGLTDLCLFTEANYTRHPSQADMHTPFGNGPASLDLFPSGAFIMPPGVVRKGNEKVD
jgi:hypothetical protein